MMLLFNAVFAAYEMALASVSRSRLSLLLQEKRRGAETAIFMKDRLEASLAVVQVGITLAGAIAAATGGAGMEETLSPYLERTLRISERLSDILAIAFLVVPLSGVTIIFAELVPKVFALRNNELVCLRLSPIMKVLCLFFYPIIFVLEAIVKKVARFGTSAFRADQEYKERGLHELRAAVSLARSSRLIGAHEEKIVLAAAQLSLRPVSAAAIPASEIASIFLASDLNEALVKAHLDMHTRFPVSEKEDDPQSIIGYVNFKDIVTALMINPSDPTVRGIARPIARFDEKTPLSKVLERMIHDKIHIALVVSEDNAVKGLVTLEDIIEELVGEIEDEYDLMPSRLYRYGSGLIAGGGALMDSITEMLGKQPQTAPRAERSPSLNEWCVKKLGRLPQGGDVIEDDGLRVLIRKTRRKRIAEALVVAHQ